MKKLLTMVMFIALPFGLLMAKNIDTVAEAIHAFEEYLCDINYFDIYEDGVWVGIGSVGIVHLTVSIVIDFLNTPLGEEAVG